MPVQKAKEVITRVPPMEEIKSIFFVVTGALIANVALAEFILPYHFLDGGVVGLSILASHYFGINLSLALIILSLPFFALGYKPLGRRAIVKAAIGVATLAFASSLVDHHSPWLPDEYNWLSFVVGGSLLGLGIGLALKSGGALDGTEILATVLAKKHQKLSVASVIIVCNLVIFGASYFAFGLVSALGSFVMFVMHVTVAMNYAMGSDHEILHTIVTTRYPLEITQIIQETVGEERHIYRRPLNRFDPEMGTFTEDWSEITFLMMRMEVEHVLAIIKARDSDCHIHTLDVAATCGSPLDNAGH